VEKFLFLGKMKDRGVASATFNSGSITVEAANDLSGQIATDLQLWDLNGGLNVLDNFPDFVIAGVPPGTAVVTDMTVFHRENHPSGFGSTIRVFGSDMGNSPAKITALNRAGDAVELNAEPGLTWFSFFGDIESVQGERYTNMQLVRADDDTNATMNQPDTWLSVGGPLTTNYTASSPSPGILRIEADHANLVGVWSISFNTLQDRTGQNFGFTWYDPDNATYDFGPNDATYPTGVEYANYRNSLEPEVVSFTKSQVAGDLWAVEFELQDITSPSYEYLGAWLHNIYRSWYSPSSGYSAEVFRSDVQGAGGTDTAFQITP